MTGAGTQHFKINITIIAILETMVMEEMQEQPMTALDLVLKITVTVSEVPVRAVLLQGE